MSIISDPPAETANGRQLKATLVLGKMLEHELPACWWRVDERGYLSGQLNTAGDDHAARAALAEWATFLGAEISEEQHDTHIKLAAEATRQGVSVRVWTHVSREKAETSA